MSEDPGLTLSAAEAAHVAEGNYDASAITVLEGLDAVRKRPGMYIGSTGERGLHHLVYEVVDNSVDEALAGYCDAILVELLDQGGIRVVDNGRGIPVGEHPKEKISALTVALTMLHAGGKFGDGGYKVSGGLHGVGVSVVNALSDSLTVDVKRDGFHWRQSFNLGNPLEPLERLEPTEETGTTVTFFASPTIFETTNYSYDTLVTRFREMAFLNKGLKITIADRRAISEDPDDEDAEVAAQREQTFQYADGLIDYVKYLTGSKEIINSTVVAIDASAPDQHMSLEVAMQWNTSFNESVHTFANTINTHEGGTHEEGFRAALTNTVNKWGETWGMIKKKEDRVSGDDIREGLTAIISVKLAEPQFEGQTKTKLGNTEARSFVQKVVNDLLGDWFEKYPAEGKDIVRKSQAAATARLAARKARDMARSRKGLLNKGQYGKLSDCSSTEPSECEVFVVEGDSAGGSAKGGRDPRTQAILPIRGKIINVEKARLDRILQNKEVEAIFNTLGTGVQDDFDVDKLRYHKIVLMADADVDGQHIQTLLLTLLFRFMRPLVELGHVYLAAPPLYKIKWNKKGDDAQYAYSDRERDGLIALRQQKKPNARPDDIQRFKGLGEMNAPDLADTTMNIETRTIKQVAVEDAIEADEMFTVLLGDQVEPRKAFIEAHAKDVWNVDWHA